MNGRLAIQVQRTLAHQAGASAFRELRGRTGGDSIEPVRREAARARRPRMARRLFPDAPGALRP